MAREENADVSDDFESFPDEDGVKGCEEEVESASLCLLGGGEGEEEEASL